MSFWNNPENNSLKVLIIALIAGVGGGFVYTWMHNDTANTGRLIGSAGSGVVMPGSTAVNMAGGSGVIPPLPTGTTGGTMPGGAIQGGSTSKGSTDKGTTDGVDGVGTTDGRDTSCDTSSPIALTATLGTPMAPVPTMVFVGPSATSPTSPGRWLNFTLANPSDCPVIVSKATIHLDTNDMTVWPPVQYVKLMNAGVQLGDTLNVPGTGTMPVGPTNFVFSHTTAHPFAVTIAPHSSQIFRVTSASQNVDANEYGGATPPATSATGATMPGTGTPVYFKMQLTQFLSKNAISGTLTNQTLTSPGALMIPGTIMTPVINIYN